MDLLSITAKWPHQQCCQFCRVGRSNWSRQCHVETEGATVFTALLPNACERGSIFSTGPDKPRATTASMLISQQQQQGQQPLPVPCSSPSKVPRLLAGCRVLVWPLMSLISVFKSSPVKFVVSHIKFVLFFFSFLVKAKYSSTMTAKCAAAQVFQFGQAERLLKSVQKKAINFTSKTVFFSSAVVLFSKQQTDLKFPPSRSPW